MRLPVAAALAAALVLAPEALRADAGRRIDYLHVQANEGGSSGGHAALRIGDWTYHFQHADGLLHMQRDPWTRFEHVYRTLQNRGIAVSRLPVSDETYELLRRGFQRRYLIQDRRLAIHASLQRDARLLEVLSGQARGEPVTRGIALRGAGFFRDTPDPGAVPETLRGLRTRVEARYGAEFLASRRRELELSFAALDAVPPDPDAIALDPGRYPARAPSFSRRYAEHWSALAALDVLARPRGLAPEARLEGIGPALAPDARERLHAQAQQLAESLTRLLASPRPDWGFPLLLGMARLAAFEESLASGRLTLLDALPDDAEALEIDTRRRQALPHLQAEARRDLEAARARALGGASWREIDWSALEIAAARNDELRRAAAGAPTLRVHVGAALPEGRARPSRLPLPRLAASELAARLDETRDAARRYRTLLQRRYGYHLVTRNCVSEIFRTIETALVDGAPAPVPEESERRLGGHVDPIAGLNFIPFVSSRHVRERYAVADRTWLPSFRRFQLAAMRRREPALRVALRESNTFTSTLYTRGAGEGFFVFFTDGSPLLRPVLGLGNVVGALAWSGVGVGLLPLDRGRALRAGLEGLLFSLPELAFVNLRKGSNEYVPPELRPPPG